MTSNKSSSDPLAGVVQTITLGMSLALGIWGTWLLMTDDPDGGRRPMGGIMLAVAVVTAFLTLLPLVRATRIATDRMF